MAELISSLFNDVPAARFGGEEFCIYLPDMASEDALRRMENFRAVVAETPVLYKDKLLSVTASIGLISAFDDNLETLLGDADKLLYTAKSQGRNQVCSRAI